MIDAALTLLPENNQELNDEEACTTLSRSSSGTTSDPLLNEDAFVRGLTSDVQLYDLDKEYKRSNNYEDVNLHPNRKKIIRHVGIYPLRHRLTLSGIHFIPFYIFYALGSF